MTGIASLAGGQSCPEVEGREELDDSICKGITLLDLTGARPFCLLVLAKGALSLFWRRLGAIFLEKVASRGLQECGEYRGL